jgi:hypothetical protein
VADEDEEEDPVMMMLLSMAKDGRSRSIGGGFVEAFCAWGFLGGGCGSRRSAAAARFSGVLVVGFCAAAADQGDRRRRLGFLGFWL